jgi:hypothetical protein
MQRDKRPEIVGEVEARPMVRGSARESALVRYRRFAVNCGYVVRYATAWAHSREAKTRAGMGAGLCRSGVAERREEVQGGAACRCRCAGPRSAWSTATLCWAQRSSAEVGSDSLSGALGTESVSNPTSQQCFCEISAMNFGLTGSVASGGGAVAVIDEAVADGDGIDPGGVAAASMPSGSGGAENSDAGSGAESPSWAGKNEMESCPSERGSAAPVAGRRSTWQASACARRDSKTQRATRAFTSASIHSSMTWRSSLRRLAARFIRESSNDWRPVADEVRKKSSGGCESLMLEYSVCDFPRERKGKNAAENIMSIQ